MTWISCMFKFGLPLGPNRGLMLPSWQHETAATLWNLSLPPAVYIAARHDCYSTDGIPLYTGHYICTGFRKQPGYITMTIKNGPAVQCFMLSIVSWFGSSFHLNLEWIICVSWSVSVNGEKCLGLWCVKIKTNENTPTDWRWTLKAFPAYPTWVDGRF